MDIDKVRIGELAKGC